jgi:endonuclease III
MNPARIRAIYRRLQEANPDPKTELNYSTPFELLVAVMLSAHTTDKSVNTATKLLYPVANTPQAILALGEEGVKPYIKPAGMYNQKAKNLIELCRRLVELHGGEVPNDREALESLPGVGRKTANVILNIVFGHTTIAVDTHIFRVSNRTGLAPGKDPLAVEQVLNEVTPAEFKRNAHHWLLLHGRYVCIARLPACPKCIIRDLCEYEPKTPEKDLAKSEAPVARNVVREAKDAAKAKARESPGGKRETAARSRAPGDGRAATGRGTATGTPGRAGNSPKRGGKPAGKAAKQSARAKTAKAAARHRAR